MKRITLLGASGSIGTQTIDILLAQKSEFRLVAFSVGKQKEKAESILHAFPSVEAVCFANEEDARHFHVFHPQLKVFHGDEGLLQLIEAVPADMLVNALVGFVGLVPTIRALEAGLTVATANKESLVVGGTLINDLLDQGKGRIIPIDSEHVGVAKCLAKAKKEVRKVYITASGGALRDVPLNELKYVTPERALAHPNWQMGAKITIDCATMMNKGFELIEACVLFRRDMDHFGVLMHRESMMHACVELPSGKYLCDISSPDMHGPIAYALSEGRCKYHLTKTNDLSKLKGLHFFNFDPERYPAVELAKRAYGRGGNALAILNAANEVAVHAFLDHIIRFTDIVPLVEMALEKLPYLPSPNLDELVATDHLTRGYVSERIRRLR